MGIQVHTVCWECFGGEEGRGGRIKSPASLCPRLSLALAWPHRQLYNMNGTIFIHWRQDLSSLPTSASRWLAFPAGSVLLSVTNNRSLEKGATERPSEPEAHPRLWGDLGGLGGWSLHGCLHLEMIDGTWVFVTDVWVHFLKTVKGHFFFCLAPTVSLTARTCKKSLFLRS